jgi:RecB family exonuclease
MISLVKIPAKKRPISYFSNRMSDFNSPRTAAIVQSNRNRRLLASSSYWELSIFTAREFFNSAAQADGVFLPPPLRSYYLQKAIKALSEEESRTLFRTGESPTNYSDYLKRSATLLPFFQEMCEERIDSALLIEKSAYDDYSEQIKILAALWNNYTELIKKDGFIDVWQSYIDFNLDETFLSRFDTFFFLISGYLNRFQMELIRCLAEKRNAEIAFNFVEGVHRQEKALEDFFGAEIKREDNDIGFRWGKAERLKDSYIISYNVGEEADELLNYSDSDIDPSEVEIISTDSGFSQYELITARIFELHFDKQVPLGKIAVALPSRELLSWFQRSDIYKLYHVSPLEAASGFGFFQFLLSLSALLEGKTHEGYPLALLEKLSAYPFIQTKINKVFFENEKRNGKLYISLKSLSERKETAQLFAVISPFFEEIDTYSAIIKKLSALLAALTESIKAIEPLSSGELAVMEDTLLQLKQLGHVFSHIKEEFPTGELLSLILNEVAGVVEKTGGKGVLVLELIESRNLQFDYLFIPGMTDSAFPSAKRHGLFLNSEGRAALGLPTFSDMNEIQKGYYYDLLARAKKTLITYPAGEDIAPSPFIYELASKAKGWLETGSVFSPSSLLAFPIRKRLDKTYDTEIVKTTERLERLRTFRYSPTSLDVFRKCQRRFYYEYIVRLRPPKTAVDSINMGELGNILHRIVKDLFVKGFSPLSPEYATQLRLAYDENISKYDYFIHDPLGAFHARILRNTLEKIAISDRKYSEEYGIVKQRFEEWIEGEYGGVSLGGKADRWDEGRDGLYLVDYKFRSQDIKSASSRDSFDDPEVDIQLPFYALMFERRFGKLPLKLFWFDLKNSYQLKEGFNMDLYNDFKDYFLSLANKILSPGIFEVPEKVKCKYCAYTSICSGYKK